MMSGARLMISVALLAVFGGCWAGTGSASLALLCMPEGALVTVSGRAVGRCGEGEVAVPAGLQTVEVRADGRLPLRLELAFEAWERYELAGVLSLAVPGLDGEWGGSGAGDVASPR